ncbi:MAG: hypothetical protein IJ240_07620 [Clostridia bacterium]|nr:hypothetical protein [Clostridia bacterium]
MDAVWSFGIDGGGTRSRLRIFDRQTGRVLAERLGASTNIYGVGEEQAKENIRALLLSAGLPLENLRTGCLGSAGLSRAGEKAMFEAFFAELLPACRMYLCNDAETLLVGALEDTEGYCLICGTGSIALARSQDGNTARAGGLGYMLGDEGSALWIGWQGVQRALRSRENRDLPTALLPALLGVFGLSTPEDFVAYMHRDFQKAKIAAAAQTVLEYAENGDELALAIEEQAVRELMALAQSVLWQLPLTRRRMALAGGVLENNQPFRERLIDSLADAAPGLELHLSKGDALSGACRLAEELKLI